MTMCAGWLAVPSLTYLPSKAVLLAVPFLVQPFSWSRYVARGINIRIGNQQNTLHYFKLGK